MKLRGDEGEEIYRQYASQFGTEPWEALTPDTRATWNNIGRRWMNDRKRSKPRRFRAGSLGRAQALHSYVIKSFGGPHWDNISQDERDKWLVLGDFRTGRMGRKARNAPDHGLKFGAAPKTEEEAKKTVSEDILEVS